MMIRRKILRLGFGLVCLFATCIGFAQNSPQWGNLKPGTYSIGYTTIRAIDYSRSYFKAGRPLQIYVWYPAAVKSHKNALKFGAYFNDAAYDWGDDTQYIAYLTKYFNKGFISGTINPSFPGELSEQQFKAILETPIPVVRNAVPAAGKFPILLHSHEGNHNQTN